MPVTLSKDASDFLLGLAAGKYDKEVAYVQRLLRLVGAVWPPARLVARALTVFMMVNRLTAPRETIQDGRGGMAPKSNSRVHPKNGRFIKWTDAGWVYDDWIGDVVKEKFPAP